MRWVKAGDSFYAVAEVIPGRVYSLRKQESRPGVEVEPYDVCWDDREGLTCTCESFAYRGDRTPLGCKHIRGMVKAGFLPGPNLRPGGGGSVAGPTTTSSSSSPAGSARSTSTGRGTTCSA